MGVLACPVELSAGRWHQQLVQQRDTDPVEPGGDLGEPAELLLALTQVEVGIIPDQHLRVVRPDRLDVPEPLIAPWVPARDRD